MRRAMWPPVGGRSMRTVTGGAASDAPGRVPPGDCTDGQGAGGDRWERGIARFAKRRTGPLAGAEETGWRDTDWQGTAWSRVEADD
jgi:hypothetical protein